MSKDKNDWINTKDKLPDKGQEVVFVSKLYSGDSGGGIYNYHVCFGEYGWENNDGFVDYTCWNDIHGYEVETNITHWMPLPEPPKD